MEKKEKNMETILDGKKMFPPELIPSWVKNNLPMKC